MKKIIALCGFLVLGFIASNTYAQTGRGGSEAKETSPQKETVQDGRGTQVIERQPATSQGQKGDKGNHYGHTKGKGHQKGKGKGHDHHNHNHQGHDHKGHDHKHDGQRGVQNTQGRGGSADGKATRPVREAGTRK